MYWHGHFQSAFFEAWAKAGLPHPDAYLSEYNETLNHIRFNPGRLNRSRQEFPALDPKLLDSVYGFGVIVGNVCAGCLGIASPATGSASDWCGRFNLGISLFDYICDESDGVGAVTALPAFHLFTGGDGRPSPSARRQTPVDEFLSNLAAGVLSDLENVCGSAAGARGRCASLWKAMREMFRAEIMASELPLSQSADFKHIRKALSLKSVEPFRVMAEWMAQSADVRESQILIRNARALGRSLGHCYWAIDDAKDVWTDLAAGRWNLFLLLAAAEDPQLFGREYDTLTDVRLTRIWERSNIARRVSADVVPRLTKAVANLQLPAKTRQNTLGLVAASLWQWYKFD